MATNKELVVRLNDWHCPHEDSYVVNLQLKFCRETQPDCIVIDEWHDFYELSRYDKNPRKQLDLQLEIDVVENYLKKLRKFCPKSKIILLDSNHLDRLRKMLWRDARAFSSLKALDIEQLLNLKDHNIEFKKDWKHKGVLFKHGTVVRRYSSYSAKGEYEKEDMSGVSGHTHRLGLYFHTTRSKQSFWMESGCGCRLDAEYIDGVPNWQHGFSAVTFIDNEVFPHLIPINNKMLQWGDKTMRL